MTWAEILSWVNTGLALFVAILQFITAYKLRKHSYLWLKIAFGVLGLYWFCVYLFVSITEPGIFDPILFGQVFVRPAFTLTLFLMASGALQRFRSSGTNK